MLFVSYFSYSSQRPGSVILQMDSYEQDICNQRLNLDTPSTLQGLQGNIFCLHAKQKECDNEAQACRLEVDGVDRQVAILQKQLGEYNKQWTDRNSNVFNPDQRKGQARAALDRFSRLSYSKQLEQVAAVAALPAEEQVIKVFTPQGIVDYWQAQIDKDCSGEKQEFEQRKQSDLNEIHGKRAPIAYQVQQFIAYKKSLEVQGNNFLYYKNQYGCLHEGYIDIFNKFQKLIRDNAEAAERKADLLRLQQEELVTIEGYPPRITFQRYQELKQQREVQELQVEKAQQAKLSQEQADEERRLEEEKKINDARSEKKAAQLAILQEQERRVEQSKRDKEYQRKLQEEERAKKLVVPKKKIDAEKRAEQSRKDKERQKEKKIRKQQKDAEDNALLDSMVLANSVQSNHAADAKVLVQRCVAGGGSVSEASRAMRIIPFKEKLNRDTHEYGSELAMSGKHTPQQSKVLIAEFQEQQKPKIEAKMVEYGKLEKLLDEYRILLSAENAIDIQKFCAIANLLDVKHKKMIDNEEGGLPYFIACDAPFFIDISDHLERWKHNLRLLNIDDIDRRLITIQAEMVQLKLMKGKSDTGVSSCLSSLEDEESKLLAQRGLLEWLACVERIQSDNGILNPKVHLGDETMKSLKSPDRYQYLSEDSLNEIKEACRVAMFSSNREIAIRDVLQSAFKQLDLFPEDGLQQAEGYASCVFNERPKLLYNDSLEDRLKLYYFQTYWRKNLEEGALYSKAQVADLSKIYCEMVMILKRPIGKK